MTWQGWLQIGIFAALAVAVVRPIGGHIARTVSGKGRLRSRFSPDSAHEPAATTPDALGDLPIAWRIFLSAR